jgi:transposase
VISRDRGGLYADGATRGAPQAVQVADRFHLLCNLTSAVERVLERKRTAPLRDAKAVTAAVNLPWSNGQVEGQIHRLKPVKRQMYGRANFNLLRRRVLPYVPGMLKLSPELSL